MEILVVAVGILVDRLTKIWALDKLKKVQDIPIIKNFFDLTYVENRGAAWGIFSGKTLVLSAVTLLVLSAIIVYMIKYRPKSKLARISLSLVISGALGNLYDRVFYKYVVDLFSLHYKDIYYYPVFNVADICVVVGTIMIAIFIVLKDDKKDGKV
ncbi:signal peptidase II [Clostridium acetobutylicum]|uniref:Lipoprotein signal peptidase n=1 Tax=Clostridium acetobutylicum (strain ATCC 824 / DSM 792 / JCM 1419 / IAM 19013 / LMG 5710 / NBRC 13948 / NRRL B-527 / VKM B-1787 / 2291 / W) TaxID=272562 RepID=LSPA_CLOAB|nr:MULTISPECIES: signal peptidase II [Clostridium]Q97H98.1 RecName: Full=Lipoprotein signal peptidase; AltName: Full=Prolipoprotein signal peptidase; AltName: Full=Signal peptidase II; Short=SPase II [Clostridium acetobutylicum ATCC 824]AAK80073.1 Lipoprotein signal peptidase [Clostridium acetobutylicum ATCC 824]ADZ21166.1 Lipoprotein signal peptidase [Clostridium acetobutylicum EA 2018]AEI33042.1 lipoprotein signal peptidase [Clostridium acetobutylicum DSM 1731]AWV79500.1 lipoprotein signal p